MGKHQLRTGFLLVTALFVIFGSLLIGTGLLLAVASESKEIGVILTMVGGIVVAGAIVLEQLIGIRPPPRYSVSIPAHEIVYATFKEPTTASGKEELVFTSAQHQEAKEGQIVCVVQGTAKFWYKITSVRKQRTADGFLIEIEYTRINNDVSIC